LAVLSGVALAAGCGQSGPPTHEVKGKVVYKGKGNINDLTDGIVSLQSTTNPNSKAVGSIEDDGSFSLGMFHEGKELQGVVAGTYKARIQPPRIDDDEGDNPRLPIHRKYLDYDKSGLTFTLPVAGDLVIEVERGR
jgi:hypothetical protein